MTNRVRTMIGFFGVAATCTIGGAAYGETAAAPENGRQVSASAAEVCTNVPTKEREMGLLAFRANIVSVAPLNEFRSLGKARYSRTEGVLIMLRATPEISVPWLERVNSCHAALASSGRLPGIDAKMDPFALPGTTVTASEIYAGYQLAVRGASVEAVQEILQRSYALVSTPAGQRTALARASMPQ